MLLTSDFVEEGAHRKFGNKSRKLILEFSVSGNRISSEHWARNCILQIRPASACHGLSQQNRAIADIGELLTVCLSFTNTAIQLLTEFAHSGQGNADRTAFTGPSCESLFALRLNLPQDHSDLLVGKNAASSQPCLLCSTQDTVRKIPLQTFEFLAGGAMVRF